MIIEEIEYFQAFELAHAYPEYGTVFLDSSNSNSPFGRYSFVGLDPFQILKSKNEQVWLNDQPLDVDPFTALETQCSRFELSPIAELPPFQGGAAGFLSYDLRHHLEKLPTTETDDFQFPDLFLSFFDVVVAFDHSQKRSFIFSSGFPEQQLNAREKRAQQRAQWAKHLILNRPPVRAVPPQVVSEKMIQSNFSEASYCQAVQKTIDYIYAGDIFEACISQRFTAPMPALTPIQLYQRLRQFNPAPFAAFVNAGDCHIASASPERFLSVQQGRVEARPIKGTRPRSKDPFKDQALAEELLKSEKDWAENVMIVDLLRNDLSRVCLDHSVKVPTLCGLESYATVHHLVSSITAKLRDDVSLVDLLRASFPGGSITGAPKVRSMEIIAEIENVVRGPYCGSVGYIGFDGNMDTSIAIRTMAIKNQTVTYQAGGAIVADSTPLEEYQETLDKAAALTRSLTHAE